MRMKGVEVLQVALDLDDALDLKPDVVHSPLVVLLPGADPRLRRPMLK